MVMDRGSREFQRYVAPLFPSQDIGIMLFLFNFQPSSKLITWHYLILCPWWEYDVSTPINTSF